ncbi:MAG: Hsp20/alpha crystallin family protein [Gemmatales bacterium]|nr:Hsp20/alpha crystallin family protein [Gemmatales bacterium]MDW8385889.1 Hsp20/alpha crystallin family protein [Gemmatales bacterium]
MKSSNAPTRKESNELMTTEATRGGTYYTPRTDIYETEEEIVFSCDMPGVKPQDFDIRFEKGQLTLHGKVAPRGPSAAYLQQEYGIGDFYRSFTVQPEIDVEKITAEYRNGVLTVHLPKQERAKPRKITVQAG